jgi:hypothetical protein
MSGPISFDFSQSIPNHLYTNIPGGVVTYQGNTYQLSGAAPYGLMLQVSIGGSLGFGQSAVHLESARKP